MKGRGTGVDARTGLPTRQKPLLAVMAIVGAAAIVAVYAAVVNRPLERQQAAPAVTAAVRGSEASRQLPPDHPSIAGGGKGGGLEHPRVAGVRAVKVPDAVRKAWQGVRLRVEVKGGGVPAKEFPVNIGGQLELPDSGLTIRVGAFLPALQVGEKQVTSATTEPINPAVQVAITEGGREIFRGWLFEKHPDVQPFDHARYRITLVGEIPRI